MCRKKKNNLRMPAVGGPEQGREICHPYPMAPAPAVAMPLPNATRVVKGAYNSEIELPAYICTDKYGRVYQPEVFYGPQACHSPVPVPMQSTVPPQVQPIVIPVNDNRRN